MRRLAILLAGAALLAGCAAPAVPEAASAVQAVSSEAGTGHAGSRTEQLAVLDGLVDFGADTAGCSLKTARAAAALVEYLSASEFEDGTADTWRAGLGRHTLAIYLLHLPVQALLVELGLYDLMRGKATIVVVLWSVLLAAVTLAVLNLSPVQRACDAVANCWYKRK